MPSVLTIPTRSRRDQFLETLEQGLSVVDIQSVNIAAHARRHWTPKFTWAQLLNRLSRIVGDTITVPELWDLRMITAAGQHPEFNPLACHAWSGCCTDGDQGALLQRLLYAFAGNCAKLEFERSSAVVRSFYVNKLRQLLQRITKLCDAELLRCHDAQL